NYDKIAPLVRQHECIIAVDGGLHHCHEMYITPDMIIGDLDSTDPEILRYYSHVPIRRFHCDKDETDLELALQCVYTPEVEKITVFGGLENRCDHTIANLHVIRRYPLKVFLETETEVLFAINGTVDIPCTPGQTISFFHVGTPPTGVTSQGLKWE